MSISSPASAYSFKNAFADYGSTADTLDQEIRNDLLAIIVDTVRSRTFSRDATVGIESLENEVNSFVEFSIYRSDLVTSIMQYNSSVPFERQVVVSQELIDIVEGDNPGELFVSVRYYQVKDLVNPSDPLEILAPL